MKANILLNVEVVSQKPNFSNLKILLMLIISDW